jgi:hypothetical protein
LDPSRASDSDAPDWVRYSIDVDVPPSPTDVSRTPSEGGRRAPSTPPYL